MKRKFKWNTGLVKIYVFTCRNSLVKVTLVTLVEADSKVSFSIANTP